MAPGNGGLSKETVPILQTEIQNLGDFAEANDCFTIVGPEVPLGLGIVDAFRSRDLEIFGPTKEQALLETSKAYAKNFMHDNSIPTADFKIYEDYERAAKYAAELSGKVAVKADGLAAGKGVIVCSNESESERAISDILQKRIFGESGNKVVVERRLEGPEISLMAICDGKDAAFLGTASDHKRLLDGDKGPNTGGMGAYSPSYNIEADQINEIMDLVVRKVVRKTGFIGFLFVGLMITSDGPRVLEFNARLGDPETQAILPRIQSDFLQHVLVASSSEMGSMQEEHPRLRSEVHTCVVAMCSEGYPDKPVTGDEITGDYSSFENDSLVFHGGTKLTRDGLVTNGGRVLYVTGLGPSLADASNAAYNRVSTISWRGEYHRKDIGQRL